MSVFIVRRARELIEAMTNDVDELRIPEDIRVRVHLGARDLLTFCANFEKRARAAVDRRNELAAKIEAAGGFARPEITREAVLVILDKGVDAFSDGAIEIIAGRLPHPED